MPDTRRVILDAMATTKWRRLRVILLVGAAVAGCAASLPPVKPVQDFKAIAGRWQGTWTGPPGTFAQAWTIKEDGSWEIVTSSPILGNTHFEGVLRLREGKIIWLSRTSGRSGTMTLHEADGRRVLTGLGDDGVITFRLTPVP